MKKILRPILCGGVLAALLCTPSLAAEQGDFSLLVNGEPVTFTDAAPVLKDGRSFLPMAATFEALGFPAEDMTWDSDTQTAAASKDGTTISLTHRREGHPGDPGRCGGRSPLSKRTRPLILTPPPAAPTSLWAWWPTPWATGWPGTGDLHRHHRRCGRHSGGEHRDL